MRSSPHPAVRLWGRLVWDLYLCMCVVSRRNAPEFPPENLGAFAGRRSLMLSVMLGAATISQLADIPQWGENGRGDIGAGRCYE
jgi:hypothetical protein